MLNVIFTQGWAWGVAETKKKNCGWINTEVLILIIFRTPIVAIIKGIIINLMILLDKPALSV